MNFRSTSVNSLPAFSLSFAFLSALPCPRHHSVRHYLSNEFNNGLGKCRNAPSWPIGNAGTAVTFGQRRTERAQVPETANQIWRAKVRNVDHLLDKCRIRRPWAGRTGSAESIRICCWRSCRCRWPIRRRIRPIPPFGSLPAGGESEIVRRPCTLGGRTLKRASLVFWPTIPAGRKQTITTLARYDCISGQIQSKAQSHESWPSLSRASGKTAAALVSRVHYAGKFDVMISSILNSGASAATFDLITAFQPPTGLLLLVKIGPADQ
jgi:hypothetical protein